MPSRELPPRPNLDHLKKQAKALLDAANERDQDALRRFTLLPSFAGKAPDAIAGDLALHDAQSVVAREHGFPSWNALREEVESRTLSFDAALDEFVRCASAGATGRAERLLALHPRIASATLQTALVLGDARAVDDRLRDHPELATAAGGPMQWPPLLYACHTSMHNGDPRASRGARRDRAATSCAWRDPNGEYHWNWHPELPRTVLWGAVCAVHHLPLAEALLAAGANPTDGVTSHIAGGGGNLDALELLHRYGLNVNGIPGGVPPLVYMMLWADNPAGPYWLLDHGADPNLAVGRRRRSAAARRRAQVGRRDGREARSVRRRRLAPAHGRRARRTRWPSCRATLTSRAGCWRTARRTSSRRSSVSSRPARAPIVRPQMRCWPSIRPCRSQLTPEHHLMLHRPAESGNAAVLEAMLSCGFGPDARDKDR